MKLIVNRSSLLAAVTLAMGAVVTNSPKPILHCVKISAPEGGPLRLDATDLAIRVSYSLDQVQIEQTGEALLQADTLRDILRECADDTIALDTDEKTGGATIRTSDSHYKIFTQDVKAYPPPAEMEKGIGFTIGVAEMQGMIDRTLFAAATEPSRYAFNGVLFKVNGSRLDMVATDGRRLALANTDLDKKLAKGLSVIVPAKALSMIDKLPAERKTTGADGKKSVEALTIECRFTESAVLFIASGVTIQTNLIEGTFPPYEDVIPKEGSRSISCGRDALLSVVKQAALLTSEESKGIRCSFSKKGLTLSSRSAGSGEATVKFPCKLEGEALDIGFNPEFLAQGLKVPGYEDMKLELTEPTRPGVIRANIGGKPAFTYVIMPVGLTEAK